jgi:hypothetical protein
MRTFAVAAVAVVLLTVPVYSQGMPGGKRQHGQGQKTEAQKKKPDDKAYNAAVSRIPDQKYDPWQIVRPSSPGNAMH